MTHFRHILPLLRYKPVFFLLSGQSAASSAVSVGLEIISVASIDRSGGGWDGQRETAVLIRKTISELWVRLGIRRNAG